MSKRDAAINADVTRYKNHLKSKVELLELQCKELDLMMSFATLEAKHREMFPEAYQRPVQNAPLNVIPKEETDGTAERKD